MQEWLAWCIAFVQTSVQWLNSVSIFGVSILGILAATILIPIIISAVMYRS